MTQLVFLTLPQPPKPPEKVNPWPAIIIASTCLGLTLAVVPWALQEKAERLKTTCKAWSAQDKKTGERTCLQWRAGEKVMK